MICTHCFFRPSEISFWECSKVSATAAYPYTAATAEIKNRKDRKGCATDQHNHEPFWNNEPDNDHHSVPGIAQEV